MKPLNWLKSLLCGTLEPLNLVVECMEEWRDIEGYEGLYQVSNMGRVKSFLLYHNVPERILKPDILKNGYLLVSLYKNNIKKRFLVHRLVLTAFVLNSENKRTCNHRNGNKTDNRLGNLEWATHSENASHCFRELGRIHPRAALGKFGKDNPGSIPVNQLSLEGELLKTYTCLMEASKKTLVNQGSISHVCRGKKNTAGGYVWRFANV